MLTFKYLRVLVFDEADEMLKASTPVLPALTSLMPP
jgi:superfamily II DNA/RNA helicase